jgi:two-component sensor histidine kinase
MSLSRVDPDRMDEVGFKERLADKLIRAFAAVALLAYIPSAYLSWRAEVWSILVVDSFALLVTALLVLKPALPYALKVGVLLAISYGLGFSLLLATGPFGAGHLYLFLFVVLAGLFGSMRPLIAANLLCLAGYAAFILIAAGTRPAWAVDLRATMVVATNAVVIGALLSVATNYLVRRYAEAASAERRLRHLREDMLKEIDHRVKNNFQMISSLVSLRARPGVEPSEALSHIKEGLSAIALVYKHLDRSEVLYTLKADLFLSSLFERFAAVYPELRFDYEWVGPELMVESDAGIDLGLMIDEIVVNAVKHAFPEGEGGRIFLRARADASTRRLSISVGDDGKREGGETPPSVGGQGKKIIAALAQHLDADMKLDTSRGYVYSFDLTLPNPDPGV